jgi:hypothetical protein
MNIVWLILEREMSVLLFTGIVMKLRHMLSRLVQEQEDSPIKPEVYSKETERGRERKRERERERERDDVTCLHPPQLQFLRQ